MSIAPKRIRLGSNVAIIAPASPFKSDELAESLDVIRELGLNPILGPNVRSLHAESIHAASIQRRVREFMWAVTDPKVSAIVAATGGFGSAGILPYLDFDLIAKNRKPFLGMSDITALNNGILAQCGLVTFNGQSPNVRLSEGLRVTRADSESLRLVFELMMSGDEWLDKPFQINQYTPRTVCSGRASGHVIGCNSDTFTNLIGTQFLPDVEGAILFIEDVHKSGETIAREFLHLKMTGILDKVSGVVIGEFVDVPRKSDPKVPSVEDVIAEYFSDSVPTIYGYSFSHGDYTIPIPVGAQCDIDADLGVVEFKFRMS
jgi:muramoyltetrapeptide carboxypeptidase